jgi:hypothetical protein
MSTRTSRRLEDDRPPLFEFTIRRHRFAVATRTNDQQVVLLEWNDSMDDYVSADAPHFPTSVAAHRHARMLTAITEGERP